MYSSCLNTISLTIIIMVMILGMITMVKLCRIRISKWS